MTNRRPLRIALAILLLATPRIASQAQDSSLAFAQPPRLGLRAAGFPDSGRAQKTFFTRHDLVPVAIAAVVTGGVAVFDERIARWTQTPHVQGGKSLNDASRRATNACAGTATYMWRMRHSG